MADRKIKTDALASDWLSHVRLFLCNRCMDFDEAWQDAKTKIPLLTLCFFSGRSENKYGRHGLWFTETFLTFCLQPPNGIWLNLIESKYLTSSTKFMGGCLGQFVIKYGIPWPRMRLAFFDFSLVQPLNGIWRTLVEASIHIVLYHVFLRTDTPTMVVDDTHVVHAIRLSGLLLLFIMLLKYGDNGSKCEFRNARSAFSKIRKVASLSCMPTAVV